MPIQTDDAASNGVKTLGKDVLRPEDRSCDVGLREQCDGSQKQRKDQIRDGDRRQQHRQRLPQEEFLATDRCGQDGLEAALLTLARDGIGGEHRRRQDRDREHVEEQVLVGQRRCSRGRREENDEQRLDQEDRGKDRQRDDDRSLAPVLAQLLSDDGTNATRVQVHRPAASTSSSMSSR